MSQHIDHASLCELKVIMENDFELLVNTFVSDSTMRVETLKAAISAGDANAVRAAAHSFKGSALNICAPDLSELCRLMEVAGKNNDLGDASELLAKIDVEFAIVARSLREL